MPCHAMLAIILRKKGKFSLRAIGEVASPRRAFARYLRSDSMRTASHDMWDLSVFLSEFAAFFFESSYSIIIQTGQRLPSEAGQAKNGDDSHRENKVPVEIDKKMRVLVVDDCPSMRRTVKTILKDIGFSNISEACDGIQALSHLKSGGYRLLMTDWNMPNLDGLSLVRMIRNDPELKDMIVIMVTAEAEKGHVVEAIKVGISDYVVKPFTAETVLKKIEKILKKDNTAG